MSVAAAIEITSRIGIGTLFVDEELAKQLLHFDPPFEIVVVASQPARAAPQHVNAEQDHDDADAAAEDGVG